MKTKSAFHFLELHGQTLASLILRQSRSFAAERVCGPGPSENQARPDQPVWKLNASFSRDGAAKS